MPSLPDSHVTGVALLLKPPQSRSARRALADSENNHPSNLTPLLDHHSSTTRTHRHAQVLASVGPENRILAYFKLVI